jgi:protein-tyrosine phosphatase
MSTARILSLQGGCNFRDLGGYRTRHGRQVAWGKVFRTGVLSYLTDDDHTRLNTLRVRSICDLRRAEERTREPTRWPSGDTQHLHWEDGTAPPSIRALAAQYQHPFTAAGMHATMLDLYRELPNWMVPRLRGMFDRVTNNDVPMVVHCAAGKDRTGIAIALLLAVLDVPYDIIVEDYLLTNTAGDFEQFILDQHNAQLGLAMNSHPLLEMPTDIRRVIFSADAAYLHSAFERIESDHGSTDAFLENVIGVDAGQREKIRDRLLTD